MTDIVQLPAWDAIPNRVEHAGWTPQRAGDRAAYVSLSIFGLLAVIGAFIGFSAGLGIGDCIGGSIFFAAFILVPAAACIGNCWEGYREGHPLLCEDTELPKMLVECRTIREGDQPKFEVAAWDTELRPYALQTFSLDDESDALTYALDLQATVTEHELDGKARQQVSLQQREQEQLQLQQGAAIINEQLRLQQ